MMYIYYTVLENIIGKARVMILTVRNQLKSDYWHLTYVVLVNSALSEAFSRMYCKFCNATMRTSLVTL